MAKKLVRYKLPDKAKNSFFFMEGVFWGFKAYFRDI